MEDGKENLDLSKLPKAKGWFKPGVTLYQGYWVKSDLIPHIITFHQKFQTHQNNTVVLASNPKSGTTWLKALLFSIINRHRYSLSNTPLLSSNPHKIVVSPENGHDVRSLPLFSTHIPHAMLPKTVVENSRIVYISRNPLDTTVSFWNFMAGHPYSYGPEWTVEDCVETFCRGESKFGPFWDHVLGYWMASLEKPEKVLFLKYEDMMEVTASHVERIAEFVGFPFSEEEQKSGKVEEIIEFCSLRNLKELDVNKHGKSNSVAMGLEYKSFFRKGQVGDWINTLGSDMVEKVKKIVEEKLHGSDLTFRYKI